MHFIAVILAAAWFVLAGIDAAHADPISAISAIGAFLVSGTALANVALNFIVAAISFGVQTLLAKQQEKPAVQGTKTEITVGGDTPVSFVLGRYATAGHLEYANTRGHNNDQENAFLVQVISLGDMPGQNMTGLWIDDDKIDISGFDPDATYSSDGWPVPGFDSDDSGQALWIRYYDGTQTEADALLVSQFGSDPDYPWDASMIGRGVPYIIVTAVYEPSLFSGIPKITVETDGIPLYDPRKDTSVGGSGAHRWADPSTWEPSSNNIVQVYNVKRGIRYEGEWIWGGQSISAWQLPLANWFAAMNACDTAIALNDGGTEPQFRSGVEISVDLEPADVIDEILKGCNGRIAEVGGIYKVSVGAPAAPVYSLSDEQIIVTEPQQLDPFPGLQDTTNGARATYPEPEEKWASKDAPPYYRSDLETLDDGRRLLADLQFPTVPYPTQIQRLIKASVEDSRRFRKHQITLPPETWSFEPLDVFAWTSARNGYTEKRFLVTGVSGRSNLLQTFSLEEIDPSDYSWTPLTDEKSYSVGKLGSIRPVPQSFSGWQVAATDIYDPATGRKRPSIEVFYAGAVKDVTDIRVEVRLAATQETIFDATKPYKAPLDQQYSTVLNGTFTPETAYEARGTYRSVSGRPFEPSAWLPVTTGTEDLKLELDQLSIEAQQTIADLRADIDQAVTDATELASDLQDQADALAAEVATRASETLANANAITAEQTARAQAISDQAATILANANARIAEITYLAGNLRALSDRVLDIDLALAESGTLVLDEVYEVRQNLTSTRENITAAYTDAITVATGPDSALVQQLTTLSAEIDGEVTSREAEVSRLDQAIVTGDAAEASSREVLAVQVRGSYDGTDTELAGGLIGGIRDAFASQYESLLTSIVSLEAGVDEQFDFLRFWPFDDDIEEWGGNGTPTWVMGGWLSPANNGSDPYVTSPDGLAVPADSYGQVRARIRKFGSPTWDGRLWWTSTYGAAFSMGQSVTVTEPTFSSSGTAVISFNTGATGTIERIRLDLSTSQSSTDGYDIDWIAIGRPSPGASIASLEELRQTLTSAIESEVTDREALSVSLTGLTDPSGATLETLTSGLVFEEKQARATSEDVILTSITALEASITDAENDISANATALTTLTSRVDTAEGEIDGIGTQITALSSSVTTLEGEVDGKADSSVVDSLSQEVALLGGGELASQATALRTATARLMEQELENVDEAARNVLGDQGNRNAIATAYQSLDSSVKAVDGRVDAQSTLISGVQVTLGTKADVAVVDTLTATVTAQGNLVTTNTAAITSLTQTVGEKASITALNALTATVEQNASDIEAVVSSVDSLGVEIDGKVSTVAFDALEVIVSDNSDELVSQSSLISGLRTDVDGKASTTALDSLTTRVTSAEGTISTHTTQISSLTTTVNGKASTTSVNALTTRVTAAENTISTHTSQITSINTSLTGKASTTALDALTSEVDQNAEDISIINTSITSLQGQIDGKASSTALNTLSQEVSDLDDVVTAQAGLLTALDSEVGAVSSSGRFRIQTIAQPNSAEATLSLELKASDGENFKRAGMYMRVNSGGAGETYFDTSKFAVLNGESLFAPFEIVGGVVRIRTAVVGSLVVPGTLTATEIQSQSISKSYVTSRQDDVNVNFTTPLHSLAITADYDGVVDGMVGMMFGSESGFRNADELSYAFVNLTVTVKRNGNTIITRTGPLTSTIVPDGANYKILNIGGVILFTFRDPVSAGNYTYTIECLTSNVQYIYNAKHKNSFLNATVRYR